MTVSAQAQLGELVKRWDEFLTDIQSQFYQALNASELQLLNIIEDDPEETQHLVETWQIFFARMEELAARIMTTWRSTVNPRVEAIAGRDNKIVYDWSTEKDKGMLMEQKLRDVLKKREIDIMGNCAELYYTRALQSGTLIFPCSQCSSMIHVVSNIFRSQYCSCTHCQTLNVYVPSMRIRVVENFILRYRLIKQ